jgi:hypothetical protein
VNVAIRGGRRTEYHLLSVAAKQAAQQSRLREPAVACPHCDAQTTPADLLRHVDSCSGPREPHPLSKWVAWPEARELGVPKGTLARWVTQGRVRSRIRAQGGRAFRLYLLRDVTKLMALRKRIGGGSGGGTRWVDRRPRR